MKTRLLICLMLAMLLLCAGASADCETHGFIVPPCSCETDGLPMWQYCTSCGQVVNGLQPCSKCGGDHYKPCGCEGGVIRSAPVRCEHCFGRGVESFTSGIDCRYCEYGFTWTYTDCSLCENGQAFCPDGYERALRCKSCSVLGSLRCLMCMDAQTTPVCPDCDPAAYTAFRYRTVMREPKKYLGMHFTVSGLVTQVEILHESTVTRVQRLTLQETQGEMTYTYLVHYFAPADAMNLLMGDQVTLWGQMVHYTSDQAPQFNAWRAELGE